MSAATKVTIAVAIVFAAVLGIYYGFSGSDRDGLAPQEQAAAQSPLPGPEPAPAEPQRTISGLGAPAPGAGGVLASDALRAVPGGGVGTQAQAPPREDLWVVRAPTLADPVAAAPAPGFVDYYVRDGDSLWTIAAAQLGDPLRWRQIAEANPGINPDRLQLWARLRIPLAPNGGLNLNHGAAVDPPPAAAGAPAGTTLHTVQLGDSLSAIARHHYGDPTRWRPIYDANRAAIGSDPDRLKVGTRLVIPAQATLPAGTQ